MDGVLFIALAGLIGLGFWWVRSSLRDDLASMIRHEVHSVMPSLFPSEVGETTDDDLPDTLFGFPVIVEDDEESESRRW